MQWSTLTYVAPKAPRTSGLANAPPTPPPPVCFADSTFRHAQILLCVPLGLAGCLVFHITSYPTSWMVCMLDYRCQCAGWCWAQVAVTGNGLFPQSCSLSWETAWSALLDLDLQGPDLTCLVDAVSYCSWENDVILCGSHGGRGLRTAQEKQHIEGYFKQTEQDPSVKQRGPEGTMTCLFHSFLPICQKRHGNSSKVVSL